MRDRYILQELKKDEKEMKKPDQEYYALDEAFRLIKEGNGEI